MRGSLICVQIKVGVNQLAGNWAERFGDTHFGFSDSGYYSRRGGHQMKEEEERSHLIFLEYSFAEFGGRRKEIEGEEGGGGGGDATGEGEGINEEKEKEKRKEKKWAGPVRFEPVRSDSVI
ncbi:hypothetical protein JCGZ_25476 [Jatropha curcas]|uniref:Uncharacterized protein n=1 Tax=Jatropha curcas TaxID=180498 RepID=A0A067JPN2_JATCU|nr:hypothetical protein JCGZ_25476 [Jatropha curcas]